VCLSENLFQELVLLIADECFQDHHSPSSASCFNMTLGVTAISVPVRQTNPHVWVTDADVYFLSSL
jgi:hypothetical protein